MCTALDDDFEDFDINSKSNNRKGYRVQDFPTADRLMACEFCRRETKEQFLLQADTE